MRLAHDARSDASVAAEMDKTAVSGIAAALAAALASAAATVTGYWLAM